MVIGAIAGFVLIASAAFFVYCRQMGKIRARQPTEYQQQGYYGPVIQKNEASVAYYEPPVEMGVEEAVHEMPSQTAQTAPLHPM